MPPLVSNARAVLELLSTSPNGLTRAELASGTYLSRPTITALIAELHQDAWIEEALSETSITGRPPIEIRLGRRAGRVAGAELGHHHIRVAVADANGRVLARREREGIDIEAYGPAALGLVAELLSDCLDATGTELTELRGLAVGIPAPVTFGNEIASSLLLANWATVDVREAVEAALARTLGADGTRHVAVLVENDANLGAHAEARMRGATCRNLAYIKVSSGIGMGLLINGEVFRGQTGVAGEFGHVAVPAAAQQLTGLRTDSLPPPCPRCRKADCLENLASTDAVVTRLRVSGPDYPDDLDIETVLDNALYRKTEHPKCLEALLDAGRWVGYALAEQVSVLDPEVVVLGGVLSRAGEILARPIRDAIATHATARAEIRVETVAPHEFDVDGYGTSPETNAEYTYRSAGAEGRGNSGPDRLRWIGLEGAFALALKETPLPELTAVRAWRQGDERLRPAEPFPA